jgi:hypothetical protein
MFDPTSTSTPQPPLPPPWGKIAGWLVVIGLLIAFVAVPSFRNNVLHAFDVTKRFFASLFGF